MGCEKENKWVKIEDGDEEFAYEYFGIVENKVVFFTRKQVFHFIWSISNQMIHNFRRDIICVEFWETFSNWWRHS